MMIMGVPPPGLSCLLFTYKIRSRGWQLLSVLVKSIAFQGLRGISSRLFQGELANGARLKVIGKHGVGVDSVDVEAATEYGIPVVHTPMACTGSVAEYTIGMMLALAHRLAYFDARVKAGDFACRERCRKVELGGKTLGIIGYGRIGQEVARMAKSAFNMKIMTFCHFTTIKEEGIKVVGSLDELLMAADFVTLHVPATRSTISLIGERELDLMKPSAFLINGARGVVVDEKALIKALKREKSPVQAWMFLMRSRRTRKTRCLRWRMSS